MSNITLKEAYIKLHTAVFLWGFTAVLGKLIHISAIPLVWWRILFTCAGILLLYKVLPSIRNIEKKYLIQYIIIGILIALHWVGFYATIKMTSASFALICLSTTTFFTSFIEPFFAKKKIDWREVAIGAIVVPGMLLVIGTLPSSMFKGVVIGLGMAFLVGIFGSWNKQLVDFAPPKSIMFVELGSGWIFLSAVMIGLFLYNEQTNFLPTSRDVVYLIIMAIFCTMLPFLFTLEALKKVSAFAANLTINLEPVYGILLAWVILREDKLLTTQFYIGAAIIVLAVIVYPLWLQRFHRKFMFAKFTKRKE
ncbi:MAG: EamA family transporter [Saprospiraceae bacterium]|nr:EamA family transporter [Saprospiraceae bacterium]